MVQVFKFRQERAFLTHTLLITVKQPNLDPNNFWVIFKVICCLRHSNKIVQDFGILIKSGSSDMTNYCNFIAAKTVHYSINCLLKNVTIFFFAANAAYK